MSLSSADHGQHRQAPELLLDDSSQIADSSCTAANLHATDVSQMFASKSEISGQEPLRGNLLDTGEWAGIGFEMIDAE